MKSSICLLNGSVGLFGQSILATVAIHTPLNSLGLDANSMFKAL